MPSHRLSLRFRDELKEIVAQQFLFSFAKIVAVGLVHESERPIREETANQSREVFQNAHQAKDVFRLNAFLSLQLGPERLRVRERILPEPRYGPVRTVRARKSVRRVHRRVQGRRAEGAALERAEQVPVRQEMLEEQRGLVGP